MSCYNRNNTAHGKKYHLFWDYERLLTLSSSSWLFSASSLATDVHFQGEKFPLPKMTMTPRLSMPSSQTLGREAVGGAPNIIIRGRMWSQSDRLSDPDFEFLLLLAPSLLDRRRKIKMVVAQIDKDTFPKPMVAIPDALKTADCWHKCLLNSTE